MPSFSELSREAGDFSDEIFARGYIISKRLPSCPEGWSENNFDDFIISHHPGITVSHSTTSGAQLLCMGIIFDARYPQLNKQDFLNQLVEALRESEASMLQLLNHSNGRYVLVYRGRDGVPYLLNDATGMRAALYHVGEQITVSSHLGLLESDVASAAEKDTRKFKFGFPGRRTPNKSVLLLTPNTKLNLETAEVSRYWPTSPIQNEPLSIAAEKVAILLRNSFEWIDRRYDHFATLTAGLDSRVTLAVVGSDTRYATYYRREDLDTDQLDLDVTTAMAKEFSLDHSVLGPETRETVPDGFLKTARLNTFKAHIPRMTWSYRECMVKDSENTIHIRSNLSEIGRMFYQARGSDPSDGHDLCRLWSTNKELRNDENARDFQEFAEATDFFSTPVEHSSLLYWEHRMGSWHSQVCLESDIACETLSLYNCRSLLSAMWAVSEHAQKKSLLLKRIVATRWPELTKFQVNGKEFRPQLEGDREEVFSDVEIEAALLAR